MPRTQGHARTSPLHTPDRTNSFPHIQDSIAEIRHTYHGPGILAHQSGAALHEPADRLRILADPFHIPQSKEVQHEPQPRIP